MVISFKDQKIETRLAGVAEEEGISPSLIARRDLARWYWLLDDHDPIQLDNKEMAAVASIVQSTKLFDEPSRIKKMAILVNDCIRSTTTSNGQYSKVAMYGIDPEALCGKLRAATPVQLAGLVARAEAFPKAEIDRAVLKQ